MKIDAVKRILDSLPSGAVVTMIQGHDAETATKFELRDTAPQVVKAQSPATVYATSLYHRPAWAEVGNDSARLCRGCGRADDLYHVYGAEDDEEEPTMLYEEQEAHYTAVAVDRTPSWTELVDMADGLYGLNKPGDEYPGGVL